jgi:hypothetical protein
MSEQPHQQPSTPLAQPTPFSVATGVLTIPGEPSLVVLSIETATGTHVTFMPADAAHATAASLTRSASQAATGLVLPGGPGLLS